MDYTIMKIPKIISIEGNIGAGKTTFVEKLKEKLKDDNRVVFVTEPVDIWQSIKDNENKSILERFYEDGKKYSFPFQIMAYVTRLNLLTKTIVNNPKCELIVTERSLDADRFVFAKMLYDDKMIEDINFQIYLQFYEAYKLKYKSSGIIYVNASPHICKERIDKRNRKGEEGVPIEYLIKCFKYHNDWLFDKNLLNIDANENAYYKEEDKLDIGNTWINEAVDFIYGILSPV